MDVSITLTVNGEKKTAATDPSRTLLEVVRDDVVQWWGDDGEA